MPGLYYRMDAELDPGKSLNSPIADVLARRGSASQKVGVRRLSRCRRRPSPDLRPLVVSARDRPADPGQPLIAVLKPPVDAPREIRWRLRPRAVRQVETGSVTHPERDGFNNTRHQR